MAFNRSKIERALSTAKAITYDGCHKIYILMDDAQVALSEYFNPARLQRIPDTEEGRGEALAAVREWYDRSCSLRFVSAVRTAEDDSGEVYTTLVPQSLS